MTATMELVETEGGDVWISRVGEDVEVEALQTEGSMRGHVSLMLTPGQAVKL